jgi:linoleoyl-CoA desaturase
MEYTINLIGANDKIWRIQHNVLHHSYTNIHEADDDINAPFFIRLSPHVPKNWLHRYQHLYVWVFYGLSTISWVVSEDFISLNRYYKMGLVGNKKKYWEYLAKIIMWKFVHFTITLILPIMMTSFPVWIILLAYLSKHFVTGLSLTLVFQTAHVMPQVEYPLPNENGEMESERLLHQMATTCNFGPKSRIFSWLIGGLNYQVEHHLFPNISHIHYRKLAPIVKRTAEEYGIPYLYEKNFISALGNHFAMLKTLGRS